jgi:antitoxin StbD
MSNPGLIPTTLEKCTYPNLVLNFAPYQWEAIMERILTSRAVAVSEFKRAPNEIVAEAKGEPIAVLTNNKPSFYVIPASTYESLMETIYDIESTPLLEKRLADYKAGKEKVIKVQLDSKKS